MSTVLFICLDELIEILFSPRCEVRRKELKILKDYLRLRTGSLY